MIKTMTFSLDKLPKGEHLVLVVGGIGSSRNPYGKELVRNANRAAAWVDSADKFLDIRKKEDLPQAVSSRLQELKQFAIENKCVAVASWQVEIVPDDNGEINLKSLRIGEVLGHADYVIWPVRTSEGYEVKLLKGEN